MKPLLQLFGLVVEGYWESMSNMSKLSSHRREIRKIKNEFKDDEKKMEKKIEQLKAKEAKTIIFDPFLIELSNKKNKMKNLSCYFKKKG